MDPGRCLCHVKSFGTGGVQESLAQIKIDSIPAILPSHWLQAQRMALLKDTRIRCGTSSSVNGRAREISAVEDEG